jgi:hypothetical protein
MEYQTGHSSGRVEHWLYPGRLGSQHHECVRHSDEWHRRHRCRISHLPIPHKEQEESRHGRGSAGKQLVQYCGSGWTVGMAQQRIRCFRLWEIKLRPRTEERL